MQTSSSFFSLPCKVTCVVSERERCVSERDQSPLSECHESKCERVTTALLTYLWSHHNLAPMQTTFWRRWRFRWFWTVRECADAKGAPHKGSHLTRHHIARTMRSSATSSTMQVGAETKEGGTCRSGHSGYRCTGALLLFTGNRVRALDCNREPYSG
jgi:hypothetical protein